MTCKHRIARILPAAASMRGIHRFRCEKTSDELAGPTRTALQRSSVAPLHRAERIWRNLGWVLPRLSRPTDAEIQADEYDGSIPISRWLARD
jgi:hypothetical protein